MNVLNLHVHACTHSNYTVYHDIIKALSFPCPTVEGELVTGGGAGEGDLDGVMEGEEGGGWEVGDDDLELPPDLVSH